MVNIKKGKKYGKTCHRLPSASVQSAHAPDTSVEYLNQKIFVIIQQKNPIKILMGFELATYLL